MNDLEQEVAAALGGGARFRGGELYVDAARALEAVEELRKRRVVISGFEGFELDGQDLWPRLDLIADLSSGDAAGTADPNLRARQAEAILRSFPLTQPRLVIAFSGHVAATPSS